MKANEPKLVGTSLEPEELGIRNVPDLVENHKNQAPSRSQMLEINQIWQEFSTKFGRKVTFFLPTNLALNQNW